MNHRQTHNNKRDERVRKEVEDVHDEEDSGLDHASEADQVGPSHTGTELTGTDEHC